MPPKKRNLQKNQPTLNQLFQRQQSYQVGADHSKKIDCLIDKLLKVRADVETKRREEQKLLKQIVKLKIAEGPKQDQSKEIVEEQYWMMTSEQSLLNRNVSLFDLMLTQYGQTIITQLEHHKNRQAGKDQFELKQEEQWKNRSILKLQYLQDYKAEFVNVLKQCQYVADDATTHI